MIKNSTLKPRIVAIVIPLLFSLNNGAAQTNNAEINSYTYNNVVNMVVEAINDGSISIALCKVAANPYIWNWHYETVSENGDTVKNTNIKKGTIVPGLVRTQVLDKLRGDGDIDSLLYISWSYLIVREGLTFRNEPEPYYPASSPYAGSEWIVLLDSPFHKSYHQHDILMERYEKLIGQAFLNSNNYFVPYKSNDGALCIHMPEEEKFPPLFIYSKELVDDFKTIINLQENPSLLSESDGSYEAYYGSMKEDLGKRIFSRLFENPDQE